MTWRPRWSVVWSDGNVSGRKQPRWWRLSCLACGWRSEEVDKLHGPAVRSQGVVAALWVHLRTHTP